MGLQLIFVVETNKKCNSDWIYIKDTIEHFYKYDKAHVKFTPVYMDGRGKYEKKEKEIKNWIKQYASMTKTNQTKVIYCFDCDDYDVKAEDLAFLDKVQNYCNTKGYDFVWFCKDIECVYIGEKVADSNKKSKAAMFKEKKLIEKVDDKKLNGVEYKINTSNIMSVLDGYLDRK